MKYKFKKKIVDLQKFSWNNKSIVIFRPIFFKSYFIIKKAERVVYLKVFYREGKRNVNRRNAQQQAKKGGKIITIKDSCWR